jgi:hypothetical protein
MLTLLLGKRLGCSPFVGWKSCLWTLEDWEVTEMKFSIVLGGFVQLFITSELECVIVYDFCEWGVNEEILRENQII